MIELKIVKIGALWCPGCLIVNKAISKVKEELGIEVEELDYDFDSDIVSKYNVGDILPVIVLKKDEVELGRIVGERTYKEIIDFIGGFHEE